MAGLDRDKALDMALANIEKQYGKGSVMRLGDDPRPPIGVIPTGSIALDVALGLGGLPRGRVIEIYGPESSGKCLTADTFLWTDRGLETIGELFARCGQKASCTSRVTDIRDLGVRVVNERGELEPVAALTHNNRRPVVRVTLSSGRALSATHNHPLRVMNDRGFIVWRKAGELKVGDMLVSATFGAVEAAHGDGLSEDEAVLLGYLVAEGSLSPDEAIPARVRTSGYKAQRAFLSALFEGDGWIDASSTIGLGTTSEQLAREAQLLLYGLGILSTVKVDQDNYWSLAIDPAVVQRFLTEVGFRSARRRLQAEAHFRPTSGDPQLENLPSTRSPGYAHERITSIEDGGVQPTFDIVLPETHSFIANGVLSHNTTVALHAVASAQSTGGIAAFIDAEHALDPDYAKALGVDTDALLVSQPDTGEQALEITDMLVRSGALDIVVIDSVAALVPRAEIEGEMGDSHVGLQARLMSQALRKLTGALNNSGTTLIFINQLREKIGVLFGCFSYETRVALADGTTEKIGKIVNQKLPVEVLSYDPVTDKVIPRKVVNWFDNGLTEEFLEFTVAKSGGNGRSQFAATANHLIRTPGGWQEAGDLLAGDRVMATEKHRLSQTQWQVVLGSLMGDGNLSPNRRDRNGVRFRLGHGVKQAPYLDWKVGMLGNIRCSRTTRRGSVFADFTPLAELAELRRAVYFGDGRKTLSWDYLKSLTPLALAIWYMDDGNFSVRSKGLQARTAGGSGRVTFCIEALTEGSRDRLVAYLRDTHGLDVSWRKRGAVAKAVMTFTTAASAQFLELVAPYIHPSMDCKLLPRLRDRFSVESEFVEPTLRLVPARVLDIHVKPPLRSMHRFDIEVEGNHNYLVDGVMVHNSPETTTGGKALKFYASVRLDVRRIETLKDGTDAVGNRTRIKVVKNKCLAEGTLIFDPVTGRTHRIEDIVDNRLPVSVVAAAKDNTLHVRPVTSWYDQGEQEVIGLRLQGGSDLWVTPDHQVLTDLGWKLAGDLTPGDRVARPRQFEGFGTAEPMSADHARLIGYLIGDGYVGGKTPINFINIEDELHQDVARIAETLGCRAKPQSPLSVALTHLKGKKNGVLELCRAVGIYGQLAWEKKVPECLMSADTTAEIVGNLLFGLFETDGHASVERTGAIRVGFTTTSEQLAHQIHWLLLRFGIGSTVRSYDPTQKRPSVIKGRRVHARRPVWEVRVSGSDNVASFADAVPTWGPRGRALTAALAADNGRRRGSQCGYLARDIVEPVLGHLERLGVTPHEAAAIVGPFAGDPRGGMKQVLGATRLRRDRVQALADGLDDEFLQGLLAEQLSYSAVREVLPKRRCRTFDVEVKELHTLVADDVVVHNCSPPFKQAEFDIIYGHGISREGSLIDVGVEQGLVRKSGAWYTYDGDQLGQGKENARAFLRDNPDLANDIEKRIKEKLGIGPALDADAAIDVSPVDF